MTYRNWIELGILIILVIVGMTAKIITRSKRKKIDGMGKINNYGSGIGWRMK